jgi:hypothetical protein
MFNCLLPFIPATNLDDTNLVVENSFVHEWGVCAMLPMTEIASLNNIQYLFDKTSSNDSNI